MARQSQKTIYWQQIDAFDRIRQTLKDKFSLSIKRKCETSVSMLWNGLKFHLLHKSINAKLVELAAWFIKSGFIDLHRC